MTGIIIRRTGFQVLEYNYEQLQILADLNYIRFLLIHRLKLFRNSQKVRLQLNTKRKKQELLTNLLLNT